MKSKAKKKVKAKVKAKAEVVVKTKVKAKAKVVVKKETAAVVMRRCIKKGMSAEKILETVHKAVPTSNADNNHIVYYVNELHKKGEIDSKTIAKYVKGRGRPPANGSAKKAKAVKIKVKKRKKK